MKYKYRLFSIFLVIYLCIGFYSQLFSIETKSQDLKQWLVLGPAKVPDIEKKLLDDDKTILNFGHNSIPAMSPSPGEKIPWAPGQTLQWRVLKNYDFAGYETGVVYLATYLEPSRWLKTRLTIHNTTLGASVFLDGKSIKASLLKDKITAELELTNEKHKKKKKILLLKGIKFNFNASLEMENPFQNEVIALSLSPRHRVEPENILNIVNISKIMVSPNGKLVAVLLRQTSPITGSNRSWLEILTTNNGDTVFSSKNFNKIDNFQWLKNSTSFTYTNTKKEKSSLWKYDLNTHRQTKLLGNIENLFDYWWAPDNSYLIYCTYRQDDRSDFHHIKDIPDRTAFSGYHYSMFMHFPIENGNGNSGSTHQISDENQDFQSAFISPDSQSIIFTATKADHENRPYSKNYYYLFDVKKLSTQLLLESNWLDYDSTTLMWSPNARQLLLLGGPSAFDGLGRNLPEGVIPNDYDNQAYLFDINTKKATAISKEFYPSLKESFWSPSTNNIYFVANDQEEVGVFKYHRNKNRYTRLGKDTEVVHKIGYSAHRNIAVFWGSSAIVPQKLYVLNLSSGRTSVLKDYNRPYFQNVELGTVKDWNFKSSEGRTIIGRIYYPPGFDPSKKYPCIVYYYGGTSAVTRDFGGRYPKNWYAANGYIVYVPQPTGTVGFGQELSAVHVNDWGKVTSGEIIEGVGKLIEEHKYIDPKRIGAMGASYGGFLTQYLAAHTDIFAAFISHAGITTLSSYWGVGDWGYSYSAIATAESFPWNRKDIYVGHSPLFMAERINKPLLLLHGDIDNNVPPGESYQMYAALKLLGKEVELITFKGQKHFILEYKKRLQWMRTIIAWWDKHLKNQPEHWENMYGDR